MRTIRIWPLALVLTFAAAGCAGTTATGGAVSPPTGPGDLVLRLTKLPGLLRPGGAAAVAPAFSLYADGRLISGPAADETGVWPTFAEHRVGVDEVHRLLQQAADAGLLDGSASARAGSSAPDAPVVVVTVSSASARQTSTVPRSDVPTARLSEALAARAKDPAAPYDPPAVAVIAVANEDPVAPIRAWPLADLTGQPLFGLNAGAFCTLLHGSDVDTVRAAASTATAATLWRSGGRLWTLAFRPLLPDERDCASL